MTLNRYERETVITFNDAEPYAHIHTSQRRQITRLSKNPAARLLEEGVHDGSPWAKFELPKDLVSFRSKRTRLDLTEEERANRAQRLRDAAALTA